MTIGTLFSVFAALGTTGIVAALYFLRQNLKRKKRRAAYPKDKVILHQFPRGIYAPSASPFVMKLETWLRMTGIPYKNEYSLQMSKKGQVPWITYNNEDIADSQICIEYLKKKFDVDLNKNLTIEQKAIAQAFFKMTEESLKWQIGLRRFIYKPDGSEAGIPRWIIWLYKRQAKKAAWLQGYGRHTESEVMQIGRDDLKAINDYIGNKKFLFGDQVCDVDASLFGMICQFVYHDKGPMNAYLNDSCPNILRFIKTIKETYWIDWEQCLRNSKKNQ